MMLISSLDTAVIEWFSDHLFGNIRLRITFHCINVHCYNVNINLDTHESLAEIIKFQTVWIGRGFSLFIDIFLDMNDFSFEPYSLLMQVYWIHSRLTVWLLWKIQNTLFHHRLSPCRYFDLEILISCSNIIGIHFWGDCLAFKFLDGSWLYNRSDKLNSVQTDKVYMLLLYTVQQ